MTIDIKKGRYWDEGITLVDGCTPCSPGCDHCWSAAQAHRFYREGEPCHESGLFTDDAGRFNGDIVVHPERLNRFDTRKPKVFAIWNDLFHGDVPPQFIGRVLSTAIGEFRHTFLLPTKRSQRMADIMCRFYADCDKKSLRSPINIWPGLTVCNQQEADEKIPIFLHVPGKKFLNIEPMLRPIDLTDLPVSNEPNRTFNCLLKNDDDHFYNSHPTIDAVILGGETGPGARPLHPDWVRSVRDQCSVAGVPFFFKQWGEWVHYCQYSFGIGSPCLSFVRTENELYRVGHKAAGRLLDGRTHDELPWEV